MAEYFSTILLRVFRSGKDQTIDLIGRQDVDKMVSTPPDAVVTTKTPRQSDTSESSDDDQPTPAKKMKQEDTKSK